MSFLKNKKLIAAGVVVLLGIIVFFNSFTVVQSGHTGVVTYMGAVQNNVMSEGFHFRPPFISKVVQMDNRVLRVDVNASSASKDLQTITSVVSINYRIDKSASAEVYKNIGADVENVIVKPAMQECVKQVTAQFTAEQLITNRQLVGEKMRELLETKIGVYGLSIEVFNIIDFAFSDEFNKAIEAKQTAQQDALRAEQELAKVKIEAQQKVEQAKAEADATRTRADAEAYAIRIVQEQLLQNPQYIEYIKIEKWDGKLPQVSGESTPIIDLRPSEGTTANP